jgi:D-tagatose-1,6-bisphosphate aldolase subunit GatZ/KbaZ
VTTSVLDGFAAAHAAGSTPGLPSICSAHPLVLDETVAHGARGDHVVLIEATCNQVNQDGGYTGIRPAEFRRDVERMAAAHGLPADRLVLGGDHLGPNPWKHLPAVEAMARAEELVDAYVRSGFTKIHLDTSMRCADDAPGPLPSGVAAERAARLAVVAERASSEVGSDPRYVIGTEGPVPGGESAGAHGIHVSRPGDVEETIELTRSGFSAAGVPDAWSRVRAVVAQPGVEFSDAELFDYRPGQAAHLSACLPADVPMVFEALSTDYQRCEALRALVEDHFAILKVGPGVTFAYREALFGLSFIEDELLGDRASAVRTVLDLAMQRDPGHWESFYPAGAGSAYARRYSRSDRSRYYWTVPEVRDAVAVLLRNLQSVGLPDELLSQHLPWLAPGQAPGIHLGTDDRPVSPEGVLRAAVRRVLDVYRSAV